MYKYYRAMPKAEAKELLEDWQYSNVSRNQGITWWAEAKEVAERYNEGDRVIVMVTSAKPINSARRQVALFTEATSHIEYKMPITEMNDFLVDAEEVELV